MDFHTTVYSTCAIEAPLLGVYNILINIKNLSSLSYQYLVQTGTTSIVNTPEEYLKEIYLMPKIENRRVVLDELIISGFEDNLNNFLKDFIK
jgi:hypothetical protein